METRKETRQVFRGEIYYANLSGAIGSEQQGTRPVLIVQNNTGNVHSPTVMVLPITKKLDVVNPQPTHIDIKNFCSFRINWFSFPIKCIWISKCNRLY